MPTTTTYAENLLQRVGFDFLPRSGEGFNFSRIANADIESIIHNVDIELLSSFVDNIVSCDFTEDDLKTHSDGIYVKLFHLCQLVIEYLVDVQDTLSANINGMAKKYAAKKREIEQLSSNLAKCDEKIASLKDDLFQAKKKKDRATNTGPSLPTLLEVPTISRIDSSFYPTQEQRPNTDPSAALEEISSTNSSTSNSSVTLHIIKSSHAIYLQMKVDPCITIQNLTNKIASRLLLSGSYSDDFESCSLFFKDKELCDLSTSISDYQVVNNSALVLMPSTSTSTLLDEKEEETVQDDIPTSETSNVEKDISLPLQTSNVNVESKLEEILSAIHTLQEVSDYRAKEDNAAQKEKSTTDTQALHIDSTVAAAADDDSDETRYSSDDDNIQDEFQQKDEESSVSSAEDIKDASDYTNDNNVGKEIKVPLLKVDTTGEVHDNEESLFNNPIEVTSSQDSSPEVDYLPQKKEAKSASAKEENDASASTCYSSSGSNIDDVDDESTKNSIETNNSSNVGYESTKEVEEHHTPTPLDESTTESEQTWGPEAQQFRFSDFDSLEMKDDDSVDEDVNETIDYSNEDGEAGITDTNLKITSGQPAAVDTSMQSIEISFSEFVPNEVHTEEKKEDEDHDLIGKKKLFGCFDLFRGKKQTKKRVLPKWKRSKRIVKED